MRRTLALFLAFAPTALADTPRASVRGPERVAVGGLILLDARASVSDKPIRWKVSGPDAPIVVMTPEGAPPGSVAIVFVAPQVGRLQFTAIARGIPAGEKEVDADAAVWIVEVGPAPNPVPPPVPPIPIPVPPVPPIPPVPPNPIPPTPIPVPPNPAPTPPPGPTPIPLPVIRGHIYATYIADARNMTVAQAAMKRNPTIEAAFPGLDASFRWYQSDEAELARLGLLPYAAQTTLPCVIIQDAAGKVVGVTPPGLGTSEALVNAIRDMRARAAR